MVSFFRCPSAVVRNGAPVGSAIPALDGLLRAYVQYDARNVLPIAGGYADQSASFGRCVDIIDAERGRYAEMHRAKAAREQKLAKMRQQGQGGKPTGRRR